jgi:hypothetical protein
MDPPPLIAAISPPGSFNIPHHDDRRNPMLVPTASIEKSWYLSRIQIFHPVQSPTSSGKTIAHEDVTFPEPQVQGGDASRRRILPNASSPEITYALG